MNLEKLLQLAAREELVGATVHAVVKYMVWHDGSTIEEGLQAYRGEVSAEILNMARERLTLLVGVAS